MGKGGKINNSKRNCKNRVRSRDEGSDDSDEDYVAEVEENVSDEDSEELGNSLDEYASEEEEDSFGSYLDEEEDVEFREVARSKKKRTSQVNRKIGVKGKVERKRKRVFYEEDEEEEDEEEEDEDYVNDEQVEEEEDDDDDEEFSLDVDNDADDDELFDEDEEELTTKKKAHVKVGKKSSKKRSSQQGRKNIRKSKVSKKPKKGRNKHRLRKKDRCDVNEEYEGDFIDDTPVTREKTNKNLGAKRRKYAVYSDSDGISGSDYDYTISEEESEQVREPSRLCRAGVKTNLRSSSSVKKLEEDEGLCEQRNPPAGKGKEKVNEVKSEVGKQTCGICLSEEDKRRLKGTLDCCSHYFCFTCIMEWSKVESRCPLCKQRFTTITKNGRTTLGVEPRNVVIEVPKRDQVYQPTEEEIRSFIDPYENVICTECHEGGEDGLMLLCDLCDSPAHTFCVGLGRQVPEGNWYCEGCRPIALGSPSSLAEDPIPDQRVTNNIFTRPPPILEGSDATLEHSPRTVFTQGLGNLPSPRFSAGDIQTSSPISGVATLTQRRQLHRRIQDLISMNRMQFMASRTDGILGVNLNNDISNTQNDLYRETALQNSRTQEISSSQSTFLDERLEANDYPSSSVQNGDLFCLRPAPMRMEAFQGQTVNVDRPVNLGLWPDFPGVAFVPAHDQFNQRNGRQGMISEVNMSPRRVREENQFYPVKEQLQGMVKSHLKSLSQDIELGADTLKDILRSSTHTILAACGLEHKRSEVHTVPPPSICTHGDRLIAEQTSILKSHCASCFDSFVRDVVKTIRDTRMPQWLRLGL